MNLVKNENTHTHSHQRLHEPSFWDEKNIVSIASDNNLFFVSSLIFGSITNCCDIDYYVWNSTVKNLSLHQNQYKIINLNLFGIDFDEPTILFNGHHHHHHSRISKKTI
ncbi:hypothetical protein DERF_006575 [Dermatophagoides farinae]|uniref:Uncharacterized protein n=1 Tax=Dermatophagoides farinae TaxID=6954 RepID=A0A922L3P1_DERFA|nr:hypothetical protein DERF_006575 [Dermatophagoides farinae]